MSDTEINITIVCIMSKDERNETQNEYSIFSIEMCYIHPHLDILKKIGIHGKTECTLSISKEGSRMQRLSTQFITN